MIVEGTMSRNIELCQLGIIGFRWDENSSFARGTADAPPLIREAFFSESSNLWSETGIDLDQPGIFFDAGDVLPTAGKDMPAAIEGAIGHLLSNDLRRATAGEGR